MVVQKSLKLLYTGWFSIREHCEVSRYATITFFIIFVHTPDYEGLAVRDYGSEIPVAFNT